MADVNLQTLSTAQSVGSAFAAFDDGTDVTLFPLVETATLADETTQENFVAADGTSYPYGGSTTGTVDINVLLTTTASRTWPKDNAEVEGKLWINLIGEDATAGTKQLALIPNAKVIASKNLDVPGTSGVFKFSIGSAPLTSATAAITIAQGWPYETGNVTYGDVAANRRVVFADVVIS